MQMWKFLPSLMLLHLAHTRLTAWESKLQNREVCELARCFTGIIRYNVYLYVYGQTVCNIQ